MKADAAMFFILGNALIALAHARAAFEAMTQSKAEECFEDLLSPSSSGTDIDISFDVNCSDNRDQFCYDYCLTYCAMQPTGQEYPFEYCRDHLPPGCSALFGGVRIVKVPFSGSSEAWSAPDSVNTQIRSFNATSILRAAQTVLSNHDVEWTDVYLGIPPQAADQNWLAEGATETDINEGQSSGVLCGKALNNTASLSQEFTALDSTASLKKFAAAQETRGIQHAGLYVAKRGWKLWQQFVPHWENELLKRFFMIPLSRNFVINDATFPDQYAANALLLQQKIDACVDTLQVEIQPMALFMTWGKLIVGLNTPGLEKTYEDYIDDWGWPIPRVSESCQAAAITCSKCVEQKTVSGSPCQWCMTAMGQTCLPYCDDSFNVALTCS